MDWHNLGEWELKTSTEFSMTWRWDIFISSELTLKDFPTIFIWFESDVHVHVSWYLFLCFDVKSKSGMNQPTNEWTIILDRLAVAEFIILYFTLLYQQAPTFFLVFTSLLQTNGRTNGHTQHSKQIDVLLPKIFLTSPSQRAPRAVPRLFWCFAASSAPWGWSSFK